MQAPAQAAPAVLVNPAKLSLDYKEHTLLKELSSSHDFKFPLAPTQTKLTNIKLLHVWFASIAKMLDRYPDVELFLFGTAATLNESKNLTLKTSICKTEKGVKIEEASGEKLRLIENIQAELQTFQQDVDTFYLFVDFLKASEYEIEINRDPDLKYLVAPTLFPPTVAPTKILQGAKLFMSPQYQETVVVGGTLAGKTRITEFTDFVFPSSIRIGTAKHVTFHYVRGNQLPESRLHQMLRPHLWRWLCAALADGPFAHLLKDTWEGDHTHLFQKLQLIQNAQREETDQVFSIFNQLMQLCKKPSKESLQTWYLQSIKDVEAVNAVTSTYRNSSDLTMISQSWLNSMYKVHAHGMGYDKLMTKISRENDGYVPIEELQRRIELDIESVNRSQAYDDFTTQNAHVFTQDKQPRRERQANAATGNPKKRPGSATPTPASGGASGSGNALKGEQRINVCHKFLQDKCEFGKECKFEHRKIKVPGAACSKFLGANPDSCDGSCGKLHENWHEIIKKVNAGEISALKGTPQSSPSATNPQPQSARGNGSRGGKGNRGGRGGRKGGKGGRSGANSREPSPSPPLPSSAPPAAADPATPRSALKRVSFHKTAGATCSRCGKDGHIEKDCFTNWHANGTRLTSPKPAPVPEQVAKDRALKYAAAQSETKGVVHSIEYAEELLQYRESVDRGKQPITYEINMFMGEEEPVSSSSLSEQQPPVSTSSGQEEAPWTRLPLTEAFTTHPLLEDEDCEQKVGQQLPMLDIFTDSTSDPRWRLVSPALTDQESESNNHRDLENEVLRLESQFCNLLQEQETQTEEAGKASFRHQLKNVCEGYAVQGALYESAQNVTVDNWYAQARRAPASSSVAEITALVEYLDSRGEQDSQGMLYTVRTEQDMMHDTLYPSEDEDEVPPLVSSSDDEDSYDESSADEEEEELHVVLVLVLLGDECKA